MDDVINIPNVGIRSIGINEISPPEPPKDMFEIDNIPIHINIELKKS